MSRLKGADLGIAVPAGAMNYRGAWSSATAYALNDVAAYNGTLIRANKTVAPMSASAPLSGTATTQSPSSGTSLAVSLPSSTAVGDVMLMACNPANASSVVNTPAGWTLVNSQASWLYVFSKVAVAGDAGSAVTITLSVSSGCTAVVRSYTSQGVDASAKASAANGTPPLPLAPPSAVATVTGDTQVTFFTEYTTNSTWNPSLSAGAASSVITPTPGTSKGLIVAEDWLSLPVGASAVSGGVLTDNTLYQGSIAAVSVLLKPSATPVPASTDWDTLVTLPTTGPIGRTSYNPAVKTDSNTTSNTPVPVDTTNLTVTFVVPASGQVDVQLSAAASVNSQGNPIFWGLRNGATDLPAPARSAVAYLAYPCRWTAKYRVTGLTPGATTTLTWTHWSGSASNVATSYGDAGITTAYGPALMEVWAA